jgi:hypothetical protein
MAVAGYPPEVYVRAWGSGGPPQPVRVRFNGRLEDLFGDVLRRKENFTDVKVVLGVRDANNEFDHEARLQD